MSAVLKPITVQPVQKPAYINRKLGNFQPWYRDNEPALTQYWDALSAAAREEQAGAGCDFQEFAFVQYDVECELVLAARESTYGRAVREY
jgi:hypothetical protein